MNSGLEDDAFEPLSLGSITPRGWLRRQLEIQAEGITGHLDDVWPDLADNQWLGGTNDGWERGPYYVDGLLPLAVLLDDDDLFAKAERWVEGFLDAQDPDGWIGPADHAQDQGHRYDPWPRFVVLKVLRQYVELTDDDRAEATMTEFCHHLLQALNHRALESWGNYRWPDLLTSVHWLYKRTGDDRLLELSTVAMQQGFDWNTHFDDFTHTAPSPLDEREMETHVVNNAMGVKAFAERYRRGDDTASDAAHTALSTLDRFHGQATGLFSGDEHFGGRHPSRGTELCAVVEFMHSLEHLTSVFGDTAFADRLERIAYNALPAAFTPDMRGHQYDQQANQVLCSIADRPWTNGPDANIYGLEPNFGCCTANLHQGWPKLATHLWMRAGDGLAAVAYAPNSVTTTVEDGVEVTIRAETQYPFADRVTLHLDSERQVEFPLLLRIPGWAKNPSLAYRDGSEAPTPGTFHSIERTWAPGDTVELDLSGPITADRGYHGSVTISRGPLVFSLSPGEDWRQIGGTTTHPDHAVFPTRPWNYGLDIGINAPEDSVDVSFEEPGDVPFSPESSPVRLTLDGQRVPEWQLDPDAHWANSIPASPTSSETPVERIRLVPYGCTNLRVTEFPLLDDAE